MNCNFTIAIRPYKQRHGWNFITIFISINCNAQMDHTWFCAFLHHDLQTKQLLTFTRQKINKIYKIMYGIYLFYYSLAITTSNPSYQSPMCNPWMHTTIQLMNACILIPNKFPKTELSTTIQYPLFWVQGMKGIGMRMHMLMCTRMYTIK